MASEVKIVIRAADESGKVFEGTISNLDQLGKSGQSVARSFESVGKAADIVSNNVQRGLGLLTKLDLTQLSTQVGAENLREAQERYNEALMQFGASSSQAETAHRAMQNAAVANERAQIRARQSIGLVGLELVSVAAQAPRTISHLMALGRSAVSAAAGMTTLQKATVGTLGALAFVGALLAIKNAMDEVGTGTEKLLTARERLKQKEEEFADFQRTRFSSVLPDLFKRGQATEERYLKQIAALRGEANAEDKLLRDANIAQAERDAEARLAIEQSAAEQIRMARMQSIPNLAALPLKAQEEVSASIGQLAPVLQQAANLETVLAIASEESRAAMLQQAAAATDKGGSHVLLDKLLKDGAITEKQYAEAVAASEARLGDQETQAHDTREAVEELASTQRLLDNEKVSVDRFTPGFSGAAVARQDALAAATSGGGSGDAGLRSAVERWETATAKSATGLDEAAATLKGAASALLAVADKLQSLGPATGGQDPLRLLNPLRND